MASNVYSSRALHDLERVFTSLAEQDASDARTAIDVLVDAVVVLERHPHVGRPVGGQVRELVISRGKTGYVALYRVRPALDRVKALAIRHQREAGYSARSGADAGARADAPRPLEARRRGPWL